MLRKAGSPIQEPLVRWLHAPRQGFSQLATLFIIIPSQAIHLMDSWNIYINLCMAFINNEADQPLTSVKEPHVVFLTSLVKNLDPSGIPILIHSE